MYNFNNWIMKYYDKKFQTVKTWIQNGFPAKC